MFSMKNINIITMLLVLLFTLNPAYAKKRQIIGKIIMVRGKVTYLSPGMMKAGSAKKGVSLTRETSILTGKNSFIRIKFIDGSFLNLGATSKIVLSEFSKKDPGVISLLKGKVRAQIPKKAKDLKKNDDYKFYIKTRNASIGVRGTDFLSLHNTDSKVTSVLTFEGKVGVASVQDSLLLPSLRKKILGVLNRDDLNAILTSGNTQMVVKGHLSGVFPAFQKSIIPVKISPKQFEKLERNGNLNFSGKGEIRKFEYDDPKNREKFVEIKEGRRKADGFFDALNEQFSPKAGGYLDIESGIYIQPEPGSKYDKVNNVYIVSGEFGKIDNKSGDYIPPKGLKIDNRKGFVLEDMSDETKLLMARDVFGITEGKLSRSIVKKMTSSLQQILVTKKAILNQEIKTDILKTPLDDDEYIYEISREFNRMKYMFKEVLKTRVGVELGFKTNEYDSFYHELVKSTKKSSKYTNLFGSLAYSNYITNKWIVRPKLSGLVHYQVSPKNTEVKDISQTKFSIALDSFYNYSISSVPTTFIVGVKINRESKLNKGHGGYSSPYVRDNEEQTLFKRDVLLRLGKSFRFNEFNTLNLDLGVFNYDGFSNSLNGQGHNLGASYARRFLPRYELRVSVKTTKLDSKVDEGDSSSLEYKLGFNIFDIADNYSLHSQYRLISTDFDSSARKTANGDERNNELLVKLRRRMSSEWMVELELQNNTFTSKLKERDFTSNQVQVGASYEF